MSKQSHTAREVKTFPDISSIPYACHLDPHTLLTKNGHLIQFVRVTDFIPFADKLDMDLRSVIREAIQVCLDVTDVSFWMHTIRRKRLLDGRDCIRTGYLTQKITEKDRYGFVNELYISVVSASTTSAFYKNSNFLNVLRPGFITKRFHQEIEVTLDKLHKITTKLATHIQAKAYEAVKLGFVEEGGGYFSEPMTFLGRIINLSETPTPLPMMDLSEFFLQHPITFGNNTIEIESAAGKHFSAMFMIKEYIELSKEAVDYILQLPQDLIMTQSVVLGQNKEAIETFNEQNKFVQQFDDGTFAKHSGLDLLYQVDTRKVSNFAKHQLSLMLIADSLPLLDKQIKRVCKRLNELGIVFVRESFQLRKAFWAQLPGNFVFLRRQRFITSNLLGGFTYLNNLYEKAPENT